MIKFSDYITFVFTESNYVPTFLFCNYILLNLCNLTIDDLRGDKR